MAIKIKTTPVIAGNGPHDEASAGIHTEISKTTTSKKNGEEEILHEEHESTFDPMVFTPAALVETLRIGMDFKMPVAQYTMLGLSIARSVPYEQGADANAAADAAYENLKGWVEGKLNQLIAEQQPEGE